MLVAALVAGCGVTAPARVNVDALVKRLGPVEARHDLEVRIVEDPKDVAARLALARLCEQQRRPSQAIDQLEAVLALGGPLGTRWHDDDRARLARLLAARGRARIARGAPTATGDLERARDFGASITDDELARAKLARAITQVRHVALKERTAGLATLRDLAASPAARVAMRALAPAVVKPAGDAPPARPVVPPTDGAWRGLSATATPADRGELGAWLWSIGARRAAWDELVAWHAAAPRRDDTLQGAYLAARAWWTPVDGVAPGIAELVGPQRCRFRGASCDPWDLVQNAIASDAIDALAVAPPAKATDPDAAFGWLAITLGQALRGEGAWGASFAARVDVAALSGDKLRAGGRGAIALLLGGDARDDAMPTTLPARYVAAATAALRGAKRDDVAALLGPLADTPDGRAILATVELAPAAPIDAPVAAALARYVTARLELVETPADRERVRAIVKAYAIDPTSADRVARDVVAGFADGALGEAYVGAVFDALGDPARARASWQAAVLASPEPLFLRGLAETVARANDPDAALVFATNAAAAAGDPAPVWTAIAEALHAKGSDVHALEAARSAIDLASDDTIGRALDVAIAASDALDRARQVTELRARRARVAPPLAPAAPGDPTDAGAAIAAYRAKPSPDTLARLWTAARWNPRDVAVRAELLAALPPGDARRPNVVAELVQLAGDRDGERARAAIRALR